MGGLGSGRYPPKGDKALKLEGKRPRKKRAATKPIAEIVPFKGKAVRRPPPPAAMNEAEQRVWQQVCRDRIPTGIDIDMLLVETYAQATVRRREMNARSDKTAADHSLLIRMDSLCSELSVKIQKAVASAVALAPPQSNEPKKGTAAYARKYPMRYLLESFSDPEQVARTRRMYDAATVAEANGWDPVRQDLDAFFDKHPEIRKLVPRSS